MPTFIQNDYLIPLQRAFAEYRDAVERDIPAVGKHSVPPSVKEAFSNLHQKYLALKDALPELSEILPEAFSRLASIAVGDDGIRFRKAVTRDDCGKLHIAFVVRTAEIQISLSVPGEPGMQAADMLNEQLLGLVNSGDSNARSIGKSETPNASKPRIDKGEGERPRGHVESAAVAAVSDACEIHIVDTGLEVHVEDEVTGSLSLRRSIPIKKQQYLAVLGAIARAFSDAQDDGAFNYAITKDNFHLVLPGKTQKTWGNFRQIVTKINRLLAFEDGVPLLKNTAGVGHAARYRPCCTLRPRQ